MNKLLVKVLSILLLPIIFLLIYTSCINKTMDIIAPAQNKLLIHYIDVGEGDCILIQVNNKNMLIDSGSKDSKSISYLKKHNIKKLDYMILTHPHEDHIGNAPSIINNFKINTIYAPKIVSSSESFKNLILAIKKKKLKITKAHSSQHIYLGDDVNCFILAPNSNSYEKTNDYSIVLKITYGNTSFLFTGDAESLSEEEMIHKGYNLKSDVLKIGHHGSNSSTTSPFLNEVAPKIAIISCGRGNSYGHPHKDTLIKLKNNKILLYRTDLDGTILLESDKNKIIKR